MVFAVLCAATEDDRIASRHVTWLKRIEVRRIAD
jgi:hypothetical protein